MARRRRRENYKERRRREIIIRVSAMILGVVLAIAGVVKWKQHKKAKEAAEVAAKVAEDEERMKQEWLEKQEEIEAMLATDTYREELTALYKKYHQIEEILYNREAYPDWLIEYLAGHEEAVDWVIGYPEYTAKSEDEINVMATEPIENYDMSRNNIPLLFQWDQRWGYASYGETGNIAMDGCGPTCLSMAVVGLKGDSSITPKVVADMAVEKNHYVEDGGSSWTLFGMGAEEYGLSSTQIETWSTKAIRSELEKGNVVVCSVGPGDFTSAGHYILLAKLNDDGTVLVNDPNSKSNSEKTWEIQRILKQTKGMWSLGR